jgi:hypothetical protein
MRWILTLCASLVCALTLSAGPALADLEPGGSGTSSSSVVFPSSTSGEDPITVTLTTDSGVPVGDSSGSLDPGIVGPAATTYIKSWSLTMQSTLWGIAWKETQNGAFYFDGKYVWQNHRFSWDTAGYHHCGLSSGFGFNISVQSCYKYGDPSISPNHMTLGDQFRVSVLIKGFPIYATHEMAVCAYPSGALTICIWK